MLVDALSQQHYASSRLPGAVNLPYEVVDEAVNVLPDKDAGIFVYCINVDREASGLEARKLVEMGYAIVRYYAAGEQD